MQRKFLTLIPGQRPPKVGGKNAQRIGDAVAHGLGGRLPLGYVDQDRKASRAFNESAYRRTISGTHEAVTLPMPGLYPVGDLSGPISDHRHASEPAPPLQTLDSAAAAPSPPLGRSSQIDPWIVDRLIDRLSTQVALRLIGEPDPQFVRDLFGTPPLAQQLGDPVVEPGVSGA